MDKIIFCANCQAETGQTLLQNKADSTELVSTCQVCNRQLKWPMDISQGELDALFQAQLEDNNWSTRLTKNRQRDEELVNGFKLSRPDLDTKPLDPSIWEEAQTQIDANNNSAPVGEVRQQPTTTNTSTVDFGDPAKYTDPNYYQPDGPAEG